MIDLRENFESLPDIVMYLQYCKYDGRRNMYDSVSSHIDEYEYHTNFVNGAWWAYQEQQSKIDRVLFIISQSEKYGDRSICGLQNEIKELLL